MSFFVMVMILMVIVTMDKKNGTTDTKYKLPSNL